MSKEIPDGWKVVRLCDVSMHIKDKINAKVSPYIEIGDIEAGAWKYRTKNKSSPGTAIQAKEGDICISTVRPTRKAMIILKDNYAVSTAFTVIRNNEEADWPFVFEALKKESFFMRLGTLETGSTYPTCSHDDVLSFEFILPPLPEQKKIAGVLFSVDNAIEKTKAIIEQTKVVKKGLMQELLTRGIPGRHNRFKKTVIGEIPEEWEVVKVGEVCNCIVPGRNKPKLFDGEIPWITMPDIIGPTIKDSQSGLYISLGEVKKCGTRVVPDGSVIMSCVGDFGIVAIADREIVINQQLHAFIPNDEIDKNFLCYSLIMQKLHMEKIATKTAVPYMNKHNCNSIPIPKPNIREQKEITSVQSTL